MDLQVTLNSFATDVFRRQADHDYISARSNYRMALRQQFLWSAHQAVEKYLKAILLFNGLSARYPTILTSKKKEFGHDLNALHAEVKTVTVLHYELEPKDHDFLSYLSSQGGNNRYLSVSAHMAPDAMHRLDRLVWSVRRYCRYIPDCGLNCTKTTPGMRDAIIRSINSPTKKSSPHTYALIGGELEQVIARSPNDPARKALLWANLFYGTKKRTRATFDAFSSMEIPPHEREYNDIDRNVLERFIRL